MGLSWGRRQVLGMSTRLPSIAGSPALPSAAATLGGLGGLSGVTTATAATISSSPVAIGGAAAAHSPAQERTFFFPI